jgi:hypothetical protein
MTSTPPDESAEPPRESHEAAATAETSAIPADAPPHPAPPTGPPQAGPPPLGPQPYPAPPFAPVYRAPRVPWVNPDRRSHVIGAGVIGALVLLGAGFGIGYASSSSDDHRPGMLRIERGGGPYVPGPPGHFRPGPRNEQFPGNGDGNGRTRLGPGGGQPASPSAATPTPSSTG